MGDPIRGQPRKVQRDVAIFGEIFYFGGFLVPPMGDLEDIHRSARCKMKERYRKRNRGIRGKYQGIRERDREKSEEMEICGRHKGIREDILLRRFLCHIRRSQRRYKEIQKRHWQMGNGRSRGNRGMWDGRLRRDTGRSM
jgi:hypothetical protein